MHESEAGAQKRLDVAASGGAGVFRLGVGAPFGGWLGRGAVALIIVGATLHGWSTPARRQRERAADTRLPAWSLALFWLCWAALLALGVYLLVAR